MDGDRITRFGVGIDGNIVTASLNAVVSAVNRALRGVGDAAEVEALEPARRVAGR
jgi:hypothetical protein